MKLKKDMQMFNKDGIYAVRRALNFDLNVNAVEKYHIKPYNNAYSEIKDVMLELGFKHRQGSGYVSIDNLTNTDIEDLTEKIAEKLPWLNKCATNIDITDIVNIHSVLDGIKEQIEQNIKQQAEIKLPKQKSKPTPDPEPDIEIESPEPESPDIDLAGLF